MVTYNLNDEAQLRNFSEIDVEIDSEFGIAWIYLNPSDRPCFNSQLIREVRTIQLLLETLEGKLPFNGELVSIHYMVIDSRMPNIFSMGGDLKLFRECVVNQDKEELLKHAKLCIDTIHSLITGCRLPISTISLVRGDAIGGGLETALSCQHFIAEKGVEMGLPEVLFNLFPGMGGYHLLTQRIPPKQAEKLMLSGRKYPVEELYEMGIVDRLVDKGKGRDAVYSYVKESSRYWNGYMAIKKVREKTVPVLYEDLIDTCNYWVDVAMNARERDLKLMEDLVKAQEYMHSSSVQESYKENIA